MRFKYICTRESNRSNETVYAVNTKSAMKCASFVGRMEMGEIITVKTKSGRKLSQVQYSPEYGYFRA